MAHPIGARFAVLRLRDFRIFVAGHATSTLGTQMAGVAGKPMIRLPNPAWSRTA